MNILIVDDHPIVVDGLSKVLQNEGYNVLIALDASDALARSDENPDIALFVVDLSLMESLDGLDLITEL